MSENLSGLNLGAPIGTHTGNTRTAVSEAGEHGAGVGVSGGHSSVNAHNSQSGALGHSSTGRTDDFNHGLGGEHASAGIPKGHSSSHPIADKFTSGSSGLGSSGDAVSGAYSGGSTGNALTGESHAHTTGAGVGPLGENTRSSHTGAGLGAAGAGLGGAAAASGLSGHSHSHDHSHSHPTSTSTSNSGVLPSGAAGGEFNKPAGVNRETALAPDALGGGSHSTTSGSHNSGAGLAGIGAGAGAAGVGAGALAGSGHNTSSSTGPTSSSTGSHGTSNSPLVGKEGATGHFGTVDHDSSRGQPIVDPKHLDSGGRHGLVFQESTGTYVHRHELEEAKGAAKKL